MLHQGCNTGFFGYTPKVFNETHISALQNPACTHARVPRTHEDEGRTRDHQRAQSQGTGATRSVTGRAARDGVLRQPSQFEAVLRAGVRVSSRNFVARALANDAGEARLGMIAGKKAASRAVDRNRAKRLIRESFRACASRFGACDITVQLRSDLRSEQTGTIRGVLQTLFDSLVRRCAAANPAARAQSDSRTSSDRQ